MDRVRREPLDLDHLRQRLAGQVRRDAAHDLDEPGRPGVDDARLAEDLELVARLLDRFVAPAHELCEELREVQTGSGFRLLRERPDHGQDRPLHGLLHGGVGRVGGPAESRRHRCGIDRLGAGQDVGGSPHDLRQDHARVSAGPEQRRVSHFLGEPTPIRLCNRLLQSLGDGPHGEEHVRPGVAVGDRERR